MEKRFIQGFRVLMWSRDCEQERVSYFVIRINYFSIIEMKFKHEYEGEEYIAFEVVKMQNPYKFE